MSTERGSTFVIVRDPRGSLVHVRRRDSGVCLGCIEVGLFEIVRALVEAQVTEEGDRLRSPLEGKR